MTRNIEEPGSTVEPSAYTPIHASAPASSSVGTGRRRTRLVRTGLLAVAALAIVAVAVRMVFSPVPQAGNMTMPLPKVVVAAPLQQRITTWTAFTGQFSAIDHVEIRAQVSGYLSEIHFTDGQIVKKGDLLFVIDPRPFDIALQNSRAQVATAEASLRLTGQQLDRTNSLVHSNYASIETLDQRTEQRHAAEATLEQAKAAVRTAELNLDWSRITAPISGRISRRLVSRGTLIAGGPAGAASTLLTTIVSQDPIYLDFDMGENDFVAYQRYLHQQRDGGQLDKTVQFDLSDETGWKHRGSLDFIDNEMDRSSGTIHARATVPNHDLLIAAGQFARLRIPTAAPANALLVPEAALSTDQSRTLVMTVNADNAVVPKVVTLGEQVDDRRIIKAGLNPDDRVIIDGLMFARPGSKVAPQPGTIAPVPGQG